jgi:hypothetical protein
MGRQFQLPVTIMNSNMVGHIVVWGFLYDIRLQERAQASRIVIRNSLPKYINEHSRIGKKAPEPNAAPLSFLSGKNYLQFASSLKLLTCHQFLPPVQSVLWSQVSHSQDVPQPPCRIVRRALRERYHLSSYIISSKFKDRNEIVANVPPAV